MKGIDFVQLWKYPTDTIKGDPSKVIKSDPSQVKMDVLLKSNAFRKVISLPTRLAEKSSSLIDVFFTNLHTEGIRTGVLVSDLSDHLPDFICSKEHIRTTQTKTTHLVQHIAKNNLATFYDKVAETCCYTVFSIDDANSAYDEFYKILTPIYDVSSPYTPTRKTKKARKPCITAEFSARVTKKNTFYHEFIKNGNQKILSN